MKSETAPEKIILILDLIPGFSMFIPDKFQVFFTPNPETETKWVKEMDGEKAEGFYFLFS